MLAFAIALVMVNRGAHRIGGLDAETDFYGGYAPAAALLARGSILTPQNTLPAVFGFVGPIYPSLLALMAGWNGAFFAAAEAISMISALATMALWGDLLRRLSGASAGLACVLLLASNGVLFRQGYWVTTDALAVALQALAVWLLLGRPVRHAEIAAGLAAALAFLTRYTGTWLVPAGCIVLAWGAPRGARARPVIGFLASFAVLALPWIVFARLHGGSVQFHQLLAFDVYGAGMPWDEFLAKVWPRFEHHPLAVFTGDPGAVTARLSHNLIDYARRDARELCGIPLAFLSAAGLLRALRNRDAGLLQILICGVWAYLALIPAGYNDRYALAVLPFLAAFASVAITALARLRPMPIGPVLAAGVLLVAVTVAGRSSVRLQRQVLVQQPLELVGAARALRAEARAGDRVIARKPHIAWLAGLQSTAYPANDDLLSLAAAARESGARWLYVSVSEVMLRPATAFLLDTTASVPGLTRRAVSIVPEQLDQTTSWLRMSVLYEIGSDFGRQPGWFFNDTRRKLHLLRGSSTMPNADVWSQRASAELVNGDTAAARVAWGVATGLDPRGAGELLHRAGGDTLQAIAARRF